MAVTTIDPFLRKTLERSLLPYMIFDYVDGKIAPLLASDGFYKSFRQGKDEEFKDFDDLSKQMIHKDDIDAFFKEFYACAKEETDNFNIDFRLHIADDKTYHPIRAIGKHFTIGTDNLMIVWYYDMSLLNAEIPQTIDDKTYESTLGLISNYYDDELTGLPRMSNFFRLADDILAKTNKKYAVIALDLTGMKTFNMKYGFEKGNELLIAFAKLLRNHYKNSLISRFGEDHFCLLTEDKDVEENLNILFKDSTNMLDGLSLPVRAGIFNGKIEVVARACDKAKLATDIGRHSPLSHFAYYEDDFFEQIQKRDYILNNLDKAIEENWIVPYYQPIMRTINGKVCDEEALARWIDPNKGVIQPNEFISVLEDARLIYKLDLAILDHVLKDFDKKKEIGMTLNPVSINISKVDFECVDIISEIKKRIVASGYPTSLITIEVTESIIAEDKDTLTKQIERFHEEGFKVWMDDFGSGYSSLNSLQNFNFDAIKIDMSFLSEFETNPKTPSLIYQTINIAKRLGIETICEGVENQKEVDFLLECGCNKLQGYYFNKPSPIEFIVGKNLILGRENPAERGYYSQIGSLSLSNPSLNGDAGTVAEIAFIGPCDGILEVEGEDVYLLRGSPSFIKICQNREFIKEKSKRGYKFLKKPDSFFVEVFKRCVSSGNWEKEELRTVRGSTTFFMRNVATNPLTGAKAIIFIISSNSSKDIGEKKNDSQEQRLLEGYVTPSDFPMPFMVSRLIKNDNGEDDLLCLFANKELSNLLGIPLPSIQGHSFGDFADAYKDEWVKIAKHVSMTGKSIQGEKFGEMSRTWLHYAVSRAKEDDCLIIVLTPFEQRNEEKEMSDFTKSVYDETYRLSTIFKLNEAYKVKMNHALYEFGKACNSDELAILEINDEKIVSKFEWMKEGVASVIDEVKEGEEDYQKLFSTGLINETNCYMLDNIENIKDIDENFYHWLRGKGIKRFIMVPLYWHKQIVGILIANNYELSLSEWTKGVMLKLSNIISNEIISHRAAKDKKKAKERKSNGFKGKFRCFLNDLKEAFFLKKKSTTEQQFIARENMKLARPTSIMFVSFESIFIPCFIIFCLLAKANGSNEYYTTDGWILNHAIACGLLLLMNVGLLIYSSMYLNGKFSKFHDMSNKTGILIDVYVILCNFFGIYISAMDYQCGGQIVVFVMMTMFAFCVYRLYPIKVVILEIISCILLTLLIQYVPLVNLPKDQLAMGLGSSTITNIVALAILQVVVAFVLYRARFKMVSASLIDKLSKTKLRAALEEDANHLINKPLVVMMLDIDDFKLINDIYGHQAGDEIIAKMGEALIEAFGLDSVYRYGGDEFLIIKKGDLTSFEKSLKKLQAEFDSNISFETRITFSAGYEEALISSYSSLERAIRDADLLLYEAKKHGKNQIVRGGVTLFAKNK